MRFIKLAVLFLFIPLALSGQIIISGEDPGKLKWKYIDTDSYRVIYPIEIDSLARIYAKNLEKYKVPISRTIGYMTGDGDGKIMPVILHPYKDANGSVSWMPRNMNLYTIPSAYDPEPLPWIKQLSIHESRHVAQMQFGMTEKHKPFTWIFGEAWNALAIALYPGSANLEGDAVIMETALTPSGRGRTADFLNYYWVAFDQGDFRGWFKWRYVSQLRYSPTYYALGYMTMGGYRYLYDSPYFFSDGLHMVASNPLKVGCLYTVGKHLTGKNWNGAWAEICDTMYGIWKTDADKRAPYIPSERVLPASKRYTNYDDHLVVGSDIYSIKQGHVHSPSLVKVDSTGKEHFVCFYPYTASAPKWDSCSGKIYWTETLPDKRWTLKTTSKIRNIRPKGGIKKMIKSDGMLYNPTFDEGNMAVVRYHNDGRSSLEILSDNVVLKRFDAPDTLQLVEVAWLSSKLYATAISDNGYGIYSITDNEIWNTILGPQPVMIKDFQAYDDELIFTCDRTGVNELYHFNPTTGNLSQKTSTRYGSSDFAYSSDGKTLYYSSQTIMGKHLFRTPVDSLMDKKVRFDSLYRYPIAERMSEQETAAAQKKGYKEAVTLDINDIKLKDPKRYYKVPHMLNLHTWFPAYVSIDNVINSMSSDYLWQTLSLGVSGFFQNNLSTAYGEAGYSAHKDPYNMTKWRHSGHIKFTYAGLYPIFQFSFDINDRGARQYNTYTDRTSDKVYMIDSRELSTPYMNGKVTMYFPFNFSRGGWNSGLIPKVSYNISNDVFNTGSIITETQKTWNTDSFSYVKTEFVGQGRGKNRIRQSVSSSLRGYIMLPVANSQVYPRWGIGAEIGAFCNIESYNISSPMGYVYGYGYLPGIIRTHGVKLSAIWQTKLIDKSPFSQQIVDILPRGLSGNASSGSFVSIHNENLVKLTADYAIPIYIGDITLGGNWLAIKRLVTYPHFDYTFIGNTGLWSAGLDLTADLHALLTIELPFSLGVTFSWNGGSAWNDFTKSGIYMNKWFVGPIFNVSF